MIKVSETLRCATVCYFLYKENCFNKATGIIENEECRKQEDNFVVEQRKYNLCKKLQIEAKKFHRCVRDFVLCFFVFAFVFVSVFYADEKIRERNRGREREFTHKFTDEERCAGLNTPNENDSELK